VGGDSGVTEPTEDGPALPQSWLNKYGAYLFIPIFLIIIVLLFWENRDPANMQSSGANSGGRAATSADMERVHNTLERLKKALEDNPRNVSALDSLAMMYSVANSYDKALAYYERHLEIEPDNKDVKIAIALTYHNMKNPDKAIALLKEILDKEPNYAFALHYLAAIYDAQHEHDLAKEYWQKIINAFPGTEIAKMAQKNIDAQHAE